MKRVLICLLMAALLIGSSACAQALDMQVSRTDGVGLPVSVWEKSDGQKYLFLPAYMDGQTLSLTYSGADSVSVMDMPLSNGAVTDIIAGGMKLRVVAGKKTENVIVMASRNLPAVHITTASGNLDYIHEKKGNKEKGAMMIVTADGETDFSEEIDQIKGHGNATFVYEKKSYQVKLDKKASLLGMDKGKTYVLLANQHENSFVRNRMTFDIARELGLNYTSEARSVDLYINGEYRGSYLLCDKVGISSGSVDITDSEDAIEFANEEYIDRGGESEPYGTNKYEKGTYKGAHWPKEPEDITGGYLFELEYEQRYADEVSGVVTPRGQAVVVKSPEEMTKAQGEYVNALLGSFERAIFAADGVDAQTGKHYTEIADFDSLVRKYMIEEVCRNYDANKSSQYFYKDSDEIDPFIYAGPVWDYDSAWGNFAKEGSMDLASPKGLSTAQKGFSYSWWPALYKQKDFAAEVRSVYDQQLRPILEIIVGDREEEAEIGIVSLDTYAQELDASAQMNFARWRVLNNRVRAVKTGADYEENIEYLRSWIKERMAYLDQNW
ncbi:MAG: CotH kinase family protein [Clostridia bacterium]|nr:CotH kinase family protein [Clostridia bacterium]